MTSTFDHAFSLARQLSVQEQARLITALVEALAARTPPPPDPPMASTHAAWERLFAFSDELRATYPEANPAARLDADRQERAAILRGNQGSDDVHP